VGAREARPWLDAAARVFDVRRLRPRRALTLRFERPSRRLLALRYEIDSRTQLVLERTESGIRARRTSLPYFVEVKGAAGVIARGLREDALEAGVPERVVSALADIFGWDLDVSELRTGDEFRVLYENTWQIGELDPEPGNVVGAELVAGGHRVTAVFFEDEDGRGAYYRPDGSAVSRELLRYPLAFTEITSLFSMVRRHPILRVRRPHLGVDFAAPAGTPVRAVAGGVIDSAKWVRQLGRAVRIAHAGGLESLYGHLTRFAAGIVPGTRVEQGQVIGYVGATGLATGPHLHFATYRDGEYVDPLTLTSGAQARVPEATRRSFERVQTAVRHHLASLPLTANAFTVSLSNFRELE
jgi:murein DD-endopeptidase MepM/ murein hydrolase activator NlpD